jgi:isoleucyl-tRNA synthetase
MRWLFCKQTPVNNLNFGYGAGKEVERKVFGTWWNVYAFFCNYARLDNFDINAPQVPVGDRPHMDRWILSNLNLLAARADEALKKYDAAAVMRAAEQFVERLSNWYVRRNRRRFWRARSDADTDKLAAYQTLYEALVKLAQILAPIVPFVTEVMYRNLVASQDPSAPESVHLCPFPQADDAIVDTELSTDMDAAADFVSRVLSLRKARQIRVRQPLSVVTAACADDWRAKALKRFEDHVLDELNVKQLAFAKDVSELAGRSVKPNFASIGPKFGGAAKAVAGALTAADPADVAARVAGGESVTVSADGETYELAPDDVVVETTCPDHIALHESPEMTVALDTALSDELVAEGMVRDLVRHVQTLRKEHDLEMDDRITLAYASDDAALQSAVTAWTDYIKTETLADQVTDTVTGEPDKTVKINGLQISLKISKG